MTQEDKDLLLRDLCARLPYGVKCRYQHIQYVENGKIIDINMFGLVNVDGHIKDICDIKPYLFPLSSMTEEQKKFFKDRPIFLDSENELVVKEDFFGNSRFTMLEDWVEVILWLVKNHFDYRGLIPMGLAIDATNLNVY